MASSLTEVNDAACKAIAATAKIGAERPGSDKYQQGHMGLIFSKGLSFSGFERNKVFLGRPGMKYLDASDISGADSEGDCRAAVVADFDDDGDPDLFVNAVQRECHMLYRNDAGVATGSGFVKVRLRATKGHPDAIGAIVKARRAEAIQAQVLAAGNGFETQSSPELIFGLGAESGARLTVRWPGRAEEDFGPVAAGGRYRLVEGTGKAEPYAARTFQFPQPLPPGLKVKPGERIETLALTSRKGESITVTLAGDRPVILNFWATTCTSCVSELPLLQRLHAEGKRRVVCVSLDPPGQGTAIDRLWEKLGLTLETGIATDESAGKLLDLSRLAIPLTFLLAPDGKIERVIQGRLREEEL